MRDMFKGKREMKVKMKVKVKVKAIVKALQGQEQVY